MPTDILGTADLRSFNMHGRMGLSQVKVFIGSSQESLEDLREVASWLEELNFEALPWDEPTLFLPGANTLQRLLEIASQVDAAVFLFAEDDRIWWRQGENAMPSPRDNVLLEYGLFLGTLGPRHAIICRKGNPRQPTDLAGMTLIDISPEKRHQARLRLLAWARNIGKPFEDPVVNDLLMQRDVLRRESQQLQQRLIFEEQKSTDLQALIYEASGLDFRSYDFADPHGSSYWKLSFDYTFFWSVVQLVSKHYETPAAWNSGIIEKLEFLHFRGRFEQSQRNNPTHTSYFIAKTFRVLRMYREEGTYTQLLRLLPSDLCESIRKAADRRAIELARESFSAGEVSASATLPKSE